MNKVELLAPCGDFKCLEVAVNYGADAVYLGGTSFSARAFANNFSHEELIQAVNYCHLRGVKVYMTLNTLLNEKELEMALEEARFAYKINVDALIVQDLGLIYRIRKEMPDFDLHASTQMHIHNLSGIEVCKKIGFKKVVIARESSIDFIKEACKLDIPIETFVHGAICVSYSGQCLMSQASKKRSANKGACAQCCRLKYCLYENDKQITAYDYLLSPKDMCLINDIPSLIEAGVSSFKIEGRMKSATYVGLVTSIYRKAIDAYYNNERYILSPKEYDDLLFVFNRGFTDSYLKNDNANIFNNQRPNHMGKEIGKVVSYRNKECLIKLSHNVNQFDGIRIISKKNDVGKILNILVVDKKKIAKAFKGEIISVKLDQMVLKGDRVVKTLDYELDKKINHFKLKQRPLDLKIRFLTNKKIIIEARMDDLYYTETFDTCPMKAIKAPLSLKDLENIFIKVDNFPFMLDKFSGEVDRAFLPKAVINDIRRRFYKSFEAFVLNNFKRSSNPFNFPYKLENDVYDEVISVNERRLKVVNDKEDYSGNIACELGAFNHLMKKPLVGYYTLNIKNSYAYEFVKRLGCDMVVLSSEMNKEEVDELTKAYIKRNRNIKPYYPYGRRTLMYLKRNPFITYTSSKELVLSDGNNFYDVYVDEIVKIVERNIECQIKDERLNICKIER